MPQTNDEKQAGTMRKIGEFARKIKDFVSNLTRHVARSHARSEDRILPEGGVKIVPPSEKYEYGGILASCRVADPLLASQAENVDLFEKKARASEKAGEVQAAQPKKLAKVFKKAAAHPRVWDEAARVMHIRYQADSIVQFSKKIGFDLESFCRKRFKDTSNISLEEMSNFAINEILDKNLASYQQYRNFLDYEYFKTRHTNVCDFRTFMLFDANSWSYSSCQSFSTPFLSPEEAQKVTDSLADPLERVEFSTRVDISELSGIKQDEPVKATLVSDPVMYEDSNYFEDIEKTKAHLVEAAGEVYPHVDFTQMGVPDDEFFKYRAEDIKRMENAYAPTGDKPKYEKIDDIPYAGQIKDLMNEMSAKLAVYFEAGGMHSDTWHAAESRQHLTPAGGLVSGYSSTMRTSFNKMSQIAQMGENYEKGFWLGREHESRHREAVYQYFCYPRDWDLAAALEKFQRNVDKMPKDKNGEPLFPEGYPVSDYKKLVAANESLASETKFANYVFRDNYMEKSQGDLDYFREKYRDIGIPPVVDNTLEISLNNANPEDGIRITNSVEYYSYSYVSPKELNNNMGRYKEMMTETFPVFDTFQEFREAFVDHMQKIYPAVDMKQLMDTSDWDKLKDCGRETMRM